MQKILIIDQDPLSRSAISNAIKDSFEVFTADSGFEGLAVAAQAQPHAVLVEVDAPGMNGYQVCEQLRAQPATEETPIIFLSSRSSLRERMLGIECGGDDYLVKPIKPEDLITKLNATMKALARQDELKQRIAEAEKTAFTAMAGNSELGRAMLFVELSYDAPNHDQLMRKLLSALRELGLSCTLYCSSEADPLWYGSIGDVTPLEQQTMLLLRQKDRIFDFGARTQINFQRVSLLVKNMPVDDPDRYGRIKDLLPVMLGAADVKIRALNTDRAIVRQAEELSHSFSVIRSTLDVLGSSLKSNQQQGVDVMRTMIEALVRELPRMGLEDDQEEWIVDLIDGAIKEATELMDSGEYIASSFTDVMDNLQALVAKQDDMVREILASTPPVDLAAEAPVDNESDAVELF